MSKLVMLGQSIEAAREMFGLSEEERNTTILEYGVGTASSPLPFADFTFDFALCAYYLFVDTKQQTVEFHLDVIRELARVAKEVRILPLIDSQGRTSAILGPVLLGLQQENYGAEIREIPAHLPQKANAMLRVWAQQCVL